MRSSILTVAMVAGLLLCGSGSFAQDAVTLTFTKIVDSFEPIPGQTGATFNIPGGAAGEPGNSGTRVSFVVEPIETGNLQLWTATTSGASRVKLVTTKTAIPGGTGTGSPATFTDGYAHRFFGSQVVFLGINQSTQTEGFYEVPATGGAIVKLVNQSSSRPDGTGKFGPTAFSAAPFNLDSGTLVFSVSGLTFSVPAAGGTLKEPLNANKFFICASGYGFGGLGGYAGPDLSGTLMPFVAFNVFGQEAIYSAPLGGFTGVAATCAGNMLKVTNGRQIASVNTKVPDDPHGRKFAAYVFTNPATDGTAVVFNGAAIPLTTNAPYDLAGLYSRNLTTGTLVKLVDTNTSVPGGAGHFEMTSSGSGIISPGWTVSGGNVVFLGYDSANIEGLYLVKTSGGPITRIIAVGEKLPGSRTVIGNSGSFFQPPIQPDSLSGNSVVFRVDFDDPVKFQGNGIYLASW